MGAIINQPARQPASPKAFYGLDKSQAEPHKQTKIGKTILNISAGISDVKGGESFAFIKINLNSRKRKGKDMSKDMRKVKRECRTMQVLMMPK